MDQTLTISGMHCQKCVGRVSAALAPFAETVSVTLDPPRATLAGVTTPDISALNSALAKAGNYSAAVVEGEATSQQSWFATYRPLLIIAAYIAAAAFAGTAGNGGIDWNAWMMNVMAGFFLVFSGFKFLNLEGFANAYASYDLLAKRWPAWGYLYPFAELALGLAYLFRFAPISTQIATVLLMGFSSLGVLKALSNKQKIQCACLGTVLNLPMSTITLVEDLAMVAMAAAGLLTLGHN